MPKAAKAKVGQNKKAVHPNSRKALSLSRKSFRDLRINKKKSARNKYDFLAEKLLWFKENMDSQKDAYTKKELVDLVNEYRHRFDEELEQITIVNSIKGRDKLQYVSREAAIKLTTEKEDAEFSSCGIEVPDLINGHHCESFKKWDGETKYIPNIKLRKISQTDVDKLNE
ncbi:translation machinery-associated protein 16-like [Gigantopelta aegis]|uniref:translation machinery-associated protein 16-like n=1 Tax=Gigantopelta aegis TaxID=1735272 RepID=UPI001B88BEB2|nr:translation machinery-associated protein 16-like [Gigantopelta aegis]